MNRKERKEEKKRIKAILEKIDKALEKEEPGKKFLVTYEDKENKEQHREEFDYNKLLELRTSLIKEEKEMFKESVKAAGQVLAAGMTAVAGIITAVTTRATKRETIDRLEAIKENDWSHEGCYQIKTSKASQEAEREVQKMI